MQTVKRCADCDTPHDKYGDVVCPVDGKKHGSRYKCPHEAGLFGRKECDTTNDGQADTRQFKDGE